ncbi:MAG: transposase [Nanoarchaeota archaeon]|nr:transposase [Nanoarchaeota archaeon]
MKNPTNKSKEKEQFKSIVKDSSGKFAKTEKINISCRFCGLKNVVKFGYNITKKGKKARYKCKDCNAKFTPSAKLIKQIKFKTNHKDIENVKTKELKKLCKLIKKSIYPFLDFKAHYTAKYDTKKFLDLLTHVAMNHDFTHNGSQTFRFVMKENTPASNTLLYHIRKSDIQELRNNFKKAFEEIFKIAKRHNVFKKRKLDVAIDLTDQLYYGNKNDFMVCETKPQKGTTHCFRFATINIVENGRRFTLLALPMHAFDEKYKIVNELINYAKSKISIRNVYVDRGFFNIKCIMTLEKQKVKWLMPAIRNRAIKKLMKEHNSPKVLEYLMGRKNFDQVKFKLVIVNDQEKIKRVFATNLKVTEDNAKILFQEYGKRWGIETSYRVKQDFKARTTSKKYVVRFFYFMFSACLYNLWILVNIMVGLAILKFIPKEPFITAKMFGVMLYTLCSYLDPGGG